MKCFHYSMVIQAAFKCVLKTLIVMFPLGFVTITSAEDTLRTTVFPVGEIFQPIVADTKEPHFSAGFRNVKTDGPLEEFTAALVSYGEHFGLARWESSGQKKWQVSVLGAVFAQFNMDSDSADLINADYTIGFAGTHRHGPVSWRFRLFHQSTHLGDEFLLSEDEVERVNFSLEAIDLAGSYEWEQWRALAGVLYILHVDPRNVDNTGVQFGLEFNDTETQLLGGRWLSGIDLQMWDQQQWGINTSIRTGIEYGRQGSGNRRIRVMLTAYDGKIPFGQFYDVDTTAYGFSVYLGY